MKLIPETQLGTNDGGVYTDSDGERYYVKFYKNAEQAKVEVLTAKLYGYLGIHTVRPEYRELENRPAVVSRFDANLCRMEPEEFSGLNEDQASQIGRMFYGAVLTKNWDIVGLGYDNILKHSQTGDLYSIDTGEAFHFRAQGGQKDFGPGVEEIDSLLSENPSASDVFTRVFSQYPHARGGRACSG